MRTNLTIDDYISGIKNKDRTILARAISLVESTNPVHRQQAAGLLSALQMAKKAKIIGISGPPGVGKSTFIETFGNYLIERDHSIAVLAIDPSSTKTGGSILGDKTRMQQLASQERAFIRPTAAGTTLGGVAAQTREAIFLCEAFGFDIILVETVGVGQSEVMVAQMVDFFLLLMQPGSGDDLQGIKRGILEICNMVVVNKADGELLQKAQVARSELELAMQILRSHDSYVPKVLTSSCFKREGLDEIWQELESFFKSQDIEAIRTAQLHGQLEKLVLTELGNYLHQNVNLKQELEQQMQKVASHQVSIYEASKKIVSQIIQGKYHED